MNGDPDPVPLRRYGEAGPLAVLLHGGPGAAGYLAPVARRLARYCRVVEPLQRRSSSGRLSVARHVLDLHQRIGSLDEQPALVGHSWGAMLALAYAAEHPGAVASLCLIGCGTFDPAARERLRVIVDGRLDETLRRRIRRLEKELPDADERLRRTGDLLLPCYSHDLLSGELGTTWCDSRGHRETWEDMLRLQSEGIYPAAFSAIKGPVLMLHGAEDPHPGAMIRASLEPGLPQLQYLELDRCGHYPWLEREARGAFFAVLERWLVAGAP